MSITPKMVKKVMTVFESLEASGLDCVSLVTLNNCESDLLFILGSFQHVFANLPEIQYSRLKGSFIC